MPDGFNDGFGGMNEHPQNNIENNDTGHFEQGAPMRYERPPAANGSPYYNNFVNDASVNNAANNMQYYYRPVPHEHPKRSGMTGFFLWVISLVFVAMSVYLIFNISHRTKLEEELSKKESYIPFNENVESSYAADVSIPKAPDVSADPDGPQISTHETIGETGSNAANTAFKNASPSVVCITAYPSGADYTVSQSGEGSGIIISDDGYIATNSHVVNDNTGTGVVITLSDGEQYLGTIIGVDKKTDIAVIKISAEGLSAADFANSDTLFVGQDVYAIGNPGGSAFSNSLTKGTVSAVNRILSTNGYVKYIQTDAAINPGNSGGALVNNAGQVIGMNTSKLVATDYEGMGFSIPSNKVVEIVNKLIKYGYVNDRGTLGIEGTTCNLYQSRKNNVPQGMVITNIYSYSPLSDTSAKIKDIITEINGVEVKTSYEFIDQLSRYKPGDEVTLKLFRSATKISERPFSFEVKVRLIDDNL